MKKYLKFTLLRAGFAGIELILLVTMAVGIFAAAKLAQQPQNLQKQAATGGFWRGKKSSVVCNENLSTTATKVVATYWGGPTNPCNDTTLKGYYVPADGTKCTTTNKCFRVYNPKGDTKFMEYKYYFPDKLDCKILWPQTRYLYQDAEECEWITPTNTPTPTRTLTPTITPPISTTPSRTPVPSRTPSPTPLSCIKDICKPPNKDCCPGYKISVNDLCSTGEECKKDYSSDFCRNIGGFCAPRVECDLGTIPEGNDYCQTNRGNQFNCCKSGTTPTPSQRQACIWVGTANSGTCTGNPPDNCYVGCLGPIINCGGRSYDDCKVLDYCTRETPCDSPPPGDGQVCGVFSNTKCTGLKVGDICDGSTTCTADGSKGTDVICKCDTGGGGGGASCTVDKPVVKGTESVTLSIESNSEYENFFFEIRNMGNSDGAGGYKPVCVTTGGDVNTPSAACPAGTYPLVFKDPATGKRKTGSKTIATAQELFTFDHNIWQPNGGHLGLAQIVGAASNGTDAPTPLDGCTAITEYFRPAVCAGSSKSGNVISSSKSIDIAIQGNPPAGTTISKFMLAFYNVDNPYGPGNSKPICVDQGIGDATWSVPVCPAGSNHYVKITDNPLASNSATFNLKLADFQYEDRLWNNQLPLNVSTNGYFFLSDGGFSRPEAACVKGFKIELGDLSPTASPSGSLSPTPSDLTPTPSDLTPTPSQDWYAPDGQKCDGINFITLHSDSLCNVPVGYITNSEEINGGEENKCVSGKPCYKAGGVIIDPGEEAKFQSRSDVPDNCDMIEPGNLPPGTVYDQLLNCSYREAPKGNIRVKVKVSWEEDRPFKFLRIYVQDTSPEPDNFLTFFDKTEGFQNGGTFEHTFTPLFNDITYKVYVTAYDEENQPIDNQGIYNQGSCESVACEKRPDDELLTFELRFLDSLKGASAQELNFLFETMVNKWINNQVSPLDISRFIRRLTQVPGLQKNTCDPKVPGGCQFNP